MADRRIDLVFGVDKEPTTANISGAINDIAAQISRNPPKIAFQLDTKATVGNINKQLEGLIKGLKPDKLVNNNKTLGSIIGSNSSKVAKSTEAQSNAIIQQKTAIDKKISALEGEKKATDRLRQARDSLNKMYETWNKNKTKENETEVLKQARTVEKMMAEIDKSPLKKYGELDSGVNKTIESLRNEGLATQELENKFKELQAAKEKFDSSPTEANYSKVIAQLTEVKTLMDGIKSQKVDTNIVSNDTKKDVEKNIAEAKKQYKSLEKKSFSSKKSTEEFVGLEEEYKKLIRLKEKFNSQPTNDNYGKLIAQLNTVESKMKEISARESRLNELFTEEKKLESESRKMDRVAADNKDGTSDASVKADERRVKIYERLRDIKAEIAELGAKDTSNVANAIKQEQAMEKIAEKQARDNERSISKAHVLSNSHNTAIMSMQNYYERWGANISKNTALQEEFNMVMGKLKANGYSSVAEVNDAMSTFKLHVKQAGGEVETLSSKIQSLMSTRLGYMLAGFVSMAAINSVRQIYQNVVQVDTAMTELKKVTDETDATYSRFLTNASNRAVKLGSTMADTVNATADFARLGYSIDAASDMADAALVYKNVGDGITDISTASESLISTIKAFPEYENNAIAVIDKFNEVGNNFAISSSGIGEALQRSAGALAAANNTIDESIALAVGMNNITQDPAKVGTTLKTASLYLRAAKTEAEEAGESTEGMASSVSKLREELMTLTNNKVDIMLDENTFKSTYQIFKELSAIWKDLADVDQANILELIGGKRNASTLSSLLTTFDDVEEALQTSKGSAGSAMKENEKVLDSIEGRMTKIKAIYESISTNVLKSGLVKAVMTVVELLGKGANQLAKIGALVPVIIGGTAIKKMFSQVGQAKALFESLTAMRNASGKLDQYDLAVQLQGLSKFQQKSVLGMVGQNWGETQLASNTAAILNNVGAFQTRAEMMAKNISLNEQYKNYIDATTLAEMKQGAARALADGKDANEAAEIAAKIAAKKAYTEAINEQIIAEISLEAAEKLDAESSEAEVAATLKESMAKRQINEAMQEEIITRMQLNKLKEEGVVLDREEIKQRFSKAVGDIKANPTNQYVPGIDKDGEKLGKSAMGGFSKLMLGLTIATTVISILVPVIRKLVTTTDEAASKLAEAKNEIKSNESQIESLQNNLDENKNKIKEIQSLGKLSITDQNDLNNLMSENQELSTQIALLKQRNAEQQKIVDKNSEKIWKNFNSNNFADFWNSSYTDNGKAKWWEKLIAFFGGDSGQILMSGSEYVEQSIGKLEELKKQYNSLFDSNGEVKDGQADVASDLKEQIQSVTSGLGEALSELENVNNEEAQALYNKVLFAMSDLETQQELVSNMLDSFDDNLSTKIYDRVGKDNEYTVDTVQSILGITDKEYEALNKLTGSADATVDVLNSYVQKKNAEWDNIYKYFGGRESYEAYVKIAENRKKAAQEITALAGKNDEKANEIFAQYLSKSEKAASRINNPMPKDPFDAYLNTDGIKNAISGNEVATAYTEYAQTIADAISAGITKANTDNPTFGNVNIDERIIRQIKNQSKSSNGIESIINNIRDDFASASSVLLGKGTFNGIEVAFSPVLQTGDGSVLLNKNTVEDYIQYLFDNLNGDFSEEKLLDLDLGIGIKPYIDEETGQKVSRLVAKAGEGVDEVIEKMRYLGSNGILNLSRKNVDDTIARYGEIIGQYDFSDTQAQELIQALSVLDTEHRVGNINLNEALPYISKKQHFDTKEIKSNLNDITKEFKKYDEDLDLELSGDSASAAIISYKDKILDYIDETLGDAAPEFKERLQNVWSEIDKDFQDSWTNETLSAIGSINGAPIWGHINTATNSGEALNEYLHEYKRAVFDQIDEANGDGWESGLKIITQDFKRHGGLLDLEIRGDNAKSEIDRYKDEVFRYIEETLGGSAPELQSAIADAWTEIDEAFANDWTSKESIHTGEFFNEFLSEYRRAVVDQSNEILGADKDMAAYLDKYSQSLSVEALGDKLSSLGLGYTQMFDFMSENDPNVSLYKVREGLQKYLDDVLNVVDTEFGTLDEDTYNLVNEERAKISKSIFGVAEEVAMDTEVNPSKYTDYIQQYRDVIISTLRDKYSVDGLDLPEGSMFTTTAVEDYSIGYGETIPIATKLVFTDENGEAKPLSPDVLNSYIKDIIGLARTAQSAENGADVITPLSDFIMQFDRVGIQTSEGWVKNIIAGAGDIADAVADVLNRLDSESAAVFLEMSSQFNGDIADLAKYIQTLDSERISIASNLLEELDSADIKLDEFKKKVEGEMSLKLLADFDITKVGEQYEKMITAISQSGSGSGLTNETINSLKSNYGNLKEYDAGKLFERTAAGIQVNHEELKKLNQEYRQETVKNFQNGLERLNQRYEEQEEKLKRLIPGTSEYANAAANLNETLGQINSMQFDFSQFQGLTSDLNNWLQVEQGGDIGDTFQSIVKSYEDMEKLYKEGKVGSEKLKSYLDLFTFQEGSVRTSDNVMETWNGLNKEIQVDGQGIGFSKKDFLRDDIQGVKNFADAMVKLGEATKTADGVYEFANIDTYDLAKSLGLSESFVKSMLENMKLFGAEIGGVKDKSDALHKTLETNKLTADDSVSKLKNNKSIKKQGWFGEGFDFNFNSANKDDLENQIDKAKGILAAMDSDDLSIKINCDASEVEAARTILVTLEQQKAKLEEPWYMKVSFNSDSSNPAEQAMSLIQDIQELVTQRQITLDVNPDADVSSLEEQIRSKVNELDGVDAGIKAKLGFDDTQVQDALTAVGDVTVKGEIDQTSLDTIKTTIESITPEITVTAGISEDKVSPYLSSSEDGTKEVTLTVGPNNGVHNYIVNEDNDKKVNLNIGTNAIANYLAKDLSKTINVTQNVTKVVTRIEKDGEVDGTAHAYGSAYATGSAFAQGNWGIPYGGVSLGGELGQELLVRNGKFMTIGDSSAEFFQHKPGDIIFNAAQTQQIFKYGKIRSGKKRGKAYATGTAFASGSSVSSNTTYKGGWNLAAIQKNTGVKTTNSTTTAAKQTATAAKQTASAAKSTKESSEKAKEAIEKFNEYAKEFFDWSEKKLEKLEDKTEKLVNRAEKNVDNGNYNRATSQYKKALDSINESIKANNAMMPQYQSVADKILEKAVSTGAIKSADATEIKSKVKDGTLDVAKYSDDVQTVIKEYETWIDKVEDSQKNIEDLIDKYEEYSNAMYEIPLTKASDKVDRLSDSLSILEKKLDFVTNASSKARIINKEINNVRSQNTAIRTAYETANSNYVSARRKINESSDAAFKGLSSKDITKIISNVQKGKYIDYSAYNNLSTSGVKAIINYNNALKSQEEAFKNLRDSNIETKISINEYAETLANLPLDKASKKLEALADSISYLDARISNAKTPKAKESALSKKQEKVNKVYDVTQNEVDETTTNQAKRATKLVNTLVGNLSEGSYKLGKDGKFAETKNASKSDKSIIELINNVISGKKVSRVGMDANSTEYTQATKYNKSVDARNESLKAVPKAEQQWISDTREISEALAGLILDTTQKNIDKVDDKITENNKRIDVASSAQRKNELLRENDKYTRQQDDAWKRAEKDSRKYINETWGDKSLKKAFKNNQEFAKANEGKSKGEKLSAKGLEIGSEAYEAVIKYNDAIDANTKIVKESTNAQLDNRKSRQENANERYNNRKEEAQRELDKAEKSYDRAQEKTESLDRNYGKKYEAALENEKKESENVAKAKQEYADSLREAYKQNKDDMSKADKIAAKDEIARADKEAREATKESAKIDEEIVDARIKKLQEYGGTDSNGNKIAGMRELESEAKNLNKVISDDKHKTTATDYQNLINNAEGQKDNLRAQNEELEKAQSTLDKRSEEWQRLQDEIDKNNESIVSLTEEQEKYNDEILNLPIQELEHENDALSETIDKQQDLIELKKDTGKVVNAEDYQVMIDASKEQVTNLLEENKLLEEQKGLVEEGSDAYYKVQKQIDDNNDAIREAEKSQRQWNDAVRELDYRKAQRELDELQNEAEKLQDSISLSKAYGGTGSPLDYIRLILNSKQQVAQYNAIKAAKVAERSNYEVGSEKYDELTQEIYDADDAIRNAKIDQAQWNTEMQNIPVGIFSDVTGLMSSVAQYIKSFAKLRKAIMRTSSEMDYIVEIGANLATIGIDAASIGFDAVAAGLSLVPESLDNLKSVGQFAGKSTLEWVQGGVDAAREINELLAENANLLVEYRDNILWKSLDAAHTKTQQLMTVFGKITDLINDDMLYDKDGGLTNFGIAKMSELTKQYQLADAEVNNYKDDINKLNKLYALGWYTTEEFNEKLTELQSGLLDSSKDSQEFKRALLDMIKETSQAELDNLNELIEARQDALNAKKDYYEYDKSIRGKTKDIQALEAQLKALENVEDAESKAKAAKLKADLADAQEELNDTINEHMLDISQDALDELRNALQDAFDDNWTELYTNLDKMEETLRSVRDSLNSPENQDIIDKTQKEILENAGIEFRKDGIDNSQIERLVLDLVDQEIRIGSLSSAERFTQALENLKNLGIDNLTDGKHITTDLGNNSAVQKMEEIDSSKLHKYDLYSEEYKAIIEFNEALRSLKHSVADSKKGKTVDEALYDTVQSIANGTFLTDLVGKATDSLTGLATNGKNVEDYYADIASMKATGQTSVTLLDRIANTLDSWSKKMSKGVIGSFFGNIFGSMSDGFTSARDSVANKSVVSDTTKAIKNWWNGVTSTVKGWFTKKDKTASYATGTKYIKKDQWAWTQEHNKEEIIVRKSDNAILTPLSKGDSVLPSYLTENLYRLAQGSLPVNNIKIPDISLPDCNYSMEINQNYDCLIKVEGSVDAAVIDDLKSFTNDLLEKSYDYTQKKMFKGYMQSGGKRKI